MLKRVEMWGDEDLWEYVRQNIIGNDAIIDTPFGKRRLTYADYTASGRGVEFVEDYLREMLRLYGNTHTEDDTTGTLTTDRVRQAERRIKQLVNADDRYRIVATGHGTTGAILHLQMILGVYIPPSTREFLVSDPAVQALLNRTRKRAPVVFVGPYEHHSNEVSWRESLAEVVAIDLTEKGRLNLQDLATKLSQKKYEGRLKIGSFSAASNVTGVKTPVYEVARLLHRHNAVVVFDYAASAPYVAMDVCRDDESYFDAIVFSPHKFVGGPGSSGILVFRESIYRRHLPPTFGSGGTVTFVSPTAQDYQQDIELREKAGTPGILQVMKAALCMELKEQLNPRRICAKEDLLLRVALKRFAAQPNIQLVGKQDASDRVAIVSFNVRCSTASAGFGEKNETAYLHPKFVVRLLNDLFGIQARAGCSCAGPYGHRLLRIDKRRSERLREAISRGKEGLKPGWVRINFHYLLIEAEFQFICDAVCFIAEYAKYFLPLYDFNVSTGNWSCMKANRMQSSFGLREALELARRGDRPKRGQAAASDYRRYLAEAKRKCESLRKTFQESALRVTGEDLFPVVYYERQNG